MMGRSLVGHAANGAALALAVLMVGAAAKLADAMRIDAPVRRAVVQRPKRGTVPRVQFEEMAASRDAAVEALNETRDELSAVNQRAQFERDRIEVMTRALEKEHGRVRSMEARVRDLEQRLAEARKTDVTENIEVVEVVEETMPPPKPAPKPAPAPIYNVPVYTVPVYTVPVYSGACASGSYGACAVPRRRGPLRMLGRIFGK